MAADRAVDGALLKPLRGRHLVCWCKPDHACRADILLELANPVSRVEKAARIIDTASRKNLKAIIGHVLVAIEACRLEDRLRDRLANREEPTP